MRNGLRSVQEPNEQGLSKGTDMDKREKRGHLLIVGAVVAVRKSIGGDYRVLGLQCEGMSTVGYVYVDDKESYRVKQLGLSTGFYDVGLEGKKGQWISHLCCYDISDISYWAFASGLRVECLIWRTVCYLLFVLILKMMRTTLHLLCSPNLFPSEMCSETSISSSTWLPFAETFFPSKWNLHLLLFQEVIRVSKTLLSKPSSWIFLMRKYWKIELLITMNLYYRCALMIWHSSPIRDSITKTGILLKVFVSFPASYQPHV